MYDGTAKHLCGIFSLRYFLKEEGGRGQVRANSSQEFICKASLSKNGKFGASYKFFFFFFKPCFLIFVRIKSVNYIYLRL